MVLVLFGYEISVCIKFKVSIRNTRNIRYRIRTEWSDGDVLYYTLGQRMKADTWCLQSNKKYALQYNRRDAIREMKNLRRLLSRKKVPEISIEKVI